MIFTFEPKGGPIFLVGEITGPVRTFTVRLILETGATTSLINQRVLKAVGFDRLRGKTGAVRPSWVEPSPAEEAQDLNGWIARTNGEQGENRMS